MLCGPCQLPQQKCRPNLLLGQPADRVGERLQPHLEVLAVRRHVLPAVPGPVVDDVRAVELEDEAGVHDGLVVRLDRLGEGEEELLLRAVVLVDDPAPQPGWGDEAVEQLLEVLPLRRCLERLEVPLEQVEALRADRAGAHTLPRVERHERMRLVVLGVRLHVLVGKSLVPGEPLGRPLLQPVEHARERHQRHADVLVAVVDHVQADVDLLGDDGSDRPLDLLLLGTGLGLRGREVRRAFARRRPAAGTRCRSATSGSGSRCASSGSLPQLVRRDRRPFSERLQLRPGDLRMATQPSGRSRFLRRRSPGRPARRIS